MSRNEKQRSHREWWNGEILFCMCWLLLFWNWHQSIIVLNPTRKIWVSDSCRGRCLSHVAVCRPWFKNNWLKYSVNYQALHHLNWVWELQKYIVVMPRLWNWLAQPNSYHYVKFSFIKVQPVNQGLQKVPNIKVCWKLTSLGSGCIFFKSTSKVILLTSALWNVRLKERACQIITAAQVQQQKNKPNKIKATQRPK